MATLSADGRPLSEEVVGQWLARALAHWDRHGYGPWLLRTRDDAQFVGRAGLKSIQMNGEDAVELGYALAPEFWGRGLATEISRAILKVAFEQLHLPSVICFTLTTNHASRKVMKKCGFRFEREGMHADLPHVFYRLFAADFSP